MSLKVWLPLNGDLTQQGTSNIQVVSGTPSYKTGKIGASALNLNNRIVFDCPALANLQTFSICFWGMTEASTTLTVNWTDLMGFTDVSASGSNGTFRWETGYNGNNGIHWHDNATNAMVNGAHNHITQHGLWKHCCVVFDYAAGKLYSYDDGVLTQTHTHAGGHFNSTGRFYLGETNKIEGRITDVRIYDHALSAAEVHEISQGLVLHYKLDSIGPGFGNPNLLLEGMTPTAAGNGATGIVRSIENGVQKIVADNPNSNWCTFGNHNTTLSLTKGDTFTFSLMIRSPDSNKKPTVYFQSGLGYYGMQGTMSNDWSIIYYTGTWSIDNLQTNIHLGFSSAPGTYYIKYFKLEKGGSVTPWAPKEGEALSNLKYIQDSSGYGHNGTILNTVSISSDTPRYSCSTKLEAANSMINCGRGGMMTDSITVNFWLKSSSWGNPVSCTEGGGWNFESSDTCFRFPVYIASVGYKYGKSATTKAQLCNNEWHMLTGIYDRINQKIQIYVDGKLDNDYATGTSNNIGYHGTNCIWIGAEATGSNTTASNGMAGLFSDFRIYCTALSADDIQQLYQVGAKVDNLGNLHTYEFNERGPNKIYKTGITQGQEISEINGMSNLKYDPHVYIEPDGSTWVRIFHHNNPTSYKFVSSDTFTTGVYKDENRWFNFDLCNYVDKWEFIVKSKTTPDATEYKYRWIQTKNPLTAVFADVSAANVIKTTTGGYSSYSWGGLYKINSNTFLCTNNGANGNWWGAVGAWNAHQGGIPGWVSVITTGYEDVYLRIDNITATSPLIAKSTKNNLWIGHNLIEF